MVAAAVPAARAARPRGGVRRRRAARVRALLPVLLALRPRGHLHRVRDAGDAGGGLPLLRPPDAPSPGGVRRACSRCRFAIKETTFITIFVAGSFFLLAIAVQARREGSLRDAPIVRTLLGVRWDDWAWGAIVFLGVYTATLHDVLHEPEGHLRPLDGARLLARPARRRPRRGAGVLLRRPAVRRRVAGAAARRGGRGGRVQAPDAAAAVPGVGVRGLAGRLLVGGREVRVAGPAPAAAADPARRRRPAGDLGVAAHA